MRTKSNFAAVVLVVSPEGVPLVRDRSFQNPFWKFPGGRGNFRDFDVEDTAIRELWEETGIVISPEDLRMIGRRKKQDHTHVIFRVDIPRLPLLRGQGVDGEEIKVFQLQDLPTMVDFLETHRRLLMKELRSGIFAQL